MKFTNGYWQMKPEITPYYAVEYESHRIRDGKLTVYAATRHIGDRGDILNSALLTIELVSPMEGAIRAEIIHHAGSAEKKPTILKNMTCAAEPEILLNGDDLLFKSGRIQARIDMRPNRFQISYEDVESGFLCESSHRNIAYMKNRDTGKAYIAEQLSISVGEKFYGLGERFTYFCKNGQSVCMWNEDGGTASEIAYKNIPFYLSNRGYGVLADSMEDVEFEIGSEKVSRLQFSVCGERLAYIVFAGPTPREVARRLTGLTGRPALPPAVSFGLWLSTSFTTSYDEKTVTSFINGISERGIPLQVLHFDCFWMKGYQWCDFTWDDETFPDPAAMLSRIKAKGLKICVWINPYIAQRSAMFDEGIKRGYLLKTKDGGVWQTDMWQAGMGIVDFTNPDAAKWYCDKLESLIDMGVDYFKTDFGERIPVKDIVWHDGSDPVAMHNFYPYLYNKTVFELLERRMGKGNACLFARSAAPGTQQFPVCWGGDCSASYVSMAETLRGGLSLSLCGFGFWSHDIGGFEQTASPDLYKRWCAFGLLSTHSRLHGSTSYRVPWLFDAEACEVLSHFVRLKCRLMPYIFAQAVIAHQEGIPVLRPMLFEFLSDPACHDLDTQYMLGDSLLVAPCFSDSGDVCYYLPAGRWTNYLSGEITQGGRFVSERHGYFSLPLMVRPDTVLVTGACETRPDYDYATGMTVELFEIANNSCHNVTVPNINGGDACIVTATRNENNISISVDRLIKHWSIRLRGILQIRSVTGGDYKIAESETIIEALSESVQITFA